MRNLFHTLACVCLFGFALSGHPACAQRAAPRSQPRVAPVPIAPRAAVRPTGDDFYLPLPPRYVAGPMVNEFRWSFDGKYVIAVQADFTITSMESDAPPPILSTSVVVWNATTHRSTTVWSDTSGAPHMPHVELLPSSNIAFILVEVHDADGSTQAGLWRVDMRHARATPVLEFRSGEGLNVSPLQPYAYVNGTDKAGAYLKPLSASGVMGAEIRPSSENWFPVDWTADGRSLVLRIVTIVPSTAPKKEKWGALDGRTRQITILESRPASYEPPKITTPFSIILEDTPLKNAKRSTLDSPFSDASVKAAWLEQKNGASVDRMLIAADATAAIPSPRNDGILYVNREGVFVAPLLKASRSVMDAARNAAQRSKLLNNGKQLALAAIMWSEDNDDNLPPAGDGLKDTLSPYIKNDDVFPGFVYTLNGGAMKDIKDPATTMMGYIPGPGGFAVVYADGHVQWKTELPLPSPPQ